MLVGIVGDANKTSKAVQARRSSGVRFLVHRHRNDSLFDGWSIAHLLTGILMGWTITPVVALAAMVLWEPLEIFVLSPILARINIEFGYETLRNSLSDIVFDTIGILLGVYILTWLVAPPFHLFR